MFNKLIYAFGVAAIACCIAEKAYNAGVDEALTKSLTKLREYSEEHPEMTLEELFSDVIEIGE